MGRRARVFGLGQCSLDAVASIESYPPSNAKCEAERIVIQGGGPVATAMVALARWGVPCAYAGVIGDDPFGSMIRTSLEDEGIDTHGLVVRAGAASQFAFITAEPATGARTVFWRRPTGAALRSDEIDSSVLRRAEVLHTDGLLIDAALAAASEARAAGVRVVVDAGSLREGMLDLARRSDYFLVAESFARQLVGDDDPEGACRKLLELGPRVAGVTLGERGYVALVGDRLIRRTAHEADAIDTTGCGDVFHAGFSYGLLEKWPVEQCLDFGAWAAAAVSTKLGGRTGIPAVEDYPRRAPGGLPWPGAPHPGSP